MTTPSSITIWKNTGFAFKLREQQFDFSVGNTSACSACSEIWQTLTISSLSSGERLEIFRSTDLHGHKGTLLLQSHLPPACHISLASYRSTQLSGVEGEGERENNCISRKSWNSFIIYKFHSVHILRDIKRLVVMQFVLSINANPQR